MTIENLKQIAIKYATTKGSRVPLAPDELCNAVVQYFNEFLKITADINTIQVAVTEEGGNIVFTITGNTLDGKAFTPIVITVDHNDFVTDQEFEAFKTTTNAAIQKNTESINSLSFRVEDTENDITTIQVQVGQINTRVGNTETNIAKINSTLNNKLDKISSVSNSNQVYGKSAAGENLMYNLESHPNAGYLLQYDNDGNIYVNKGSSEYTPANMQNIADVEAKIPDVSNFATKEELQNVQNSLNNKRSVISSPASSYVVYTQANGLESNLPYSELANQTSTNIMARRANGTSDVKKGISGENVANMQNIADVEAKIPDVSNFATKEEIPDVSGFATKSELSNKLDISGGTINGNLTVAGNINTSVYKSRGAEVIDLDFSNTRFNVGNTRYGINIFSSNRPTVTIGEFTQNVAFKNDIPEYTSVDSVSYDSTNGAIVAYDGANEIHIPLLAGENVTIDASEDNKKIVISAAGGGGAGDVTAAGNNIFTGENEFRNYTYATSNFCFVDTKEDYLTNGYTTTIKNGGFDISYYENGEGKYWTTYADNSIINKDIDMESEVVIKFPKKEGTFALTSDIPDTSSFVTLAGNNTFTGVNTFNNSIYAKNGVVAENTTNYGANSIRKGPNTYSFPNKSGTFAMTTDVIKNPIYFISFYANEPSEPCHLIGTMMSKNSYGTGQKTNEEFAVMLADNLYTNSNEGLAAYGKLAKKDILCIYSEDGLSIRCLDEENSEVDLPTVMFFVMETEL